MSDCRVSAHDPASNFEMHLVDIEHAIPRVINHLTDFYDAFPTESSREDIISLEDSGLLNPLMLLFVCEGGFRNLAFLGSDPTCNETDAFFVHMYINVLDDLDHIIQLVKEILDRCRVSTEERTDTGSGEKARVSEGPNAKLHKRTIFILEDLCILVSIGCFDYLDAVEFVISNLRMVVSPHFHHMLRYVDWYEGNYCHSSKTDGRKRDFNRTNSTSCCRRAQLQLQLRRWLRSQHN
jgi:hypothetical protein